MKSLRQEAVGFIDWLDDTGVQPLFKKIVRFGNQLTLFWHEIITTLNVFQRVEKLKLMICVCNHRLVCAQDVVEWLQSAALAPGIDYCVECLVGKHFLVHAPKTRSCNTVFRALRPGRSPPQNYFSDFQISPMFLICCLFSRRCPSAIARLIAAGWIHAINGVKLGRGSSHV